MEQGQHGDQLRAAGKEQQGHGDEPETGMQERTGPQRRALKCREKSSLSPEELSVLRGDRRERDTGVYQCSQLTLTVRNQNFCFFLSNGRLGH